jgi:predicted Zn-dependent protease
MVWFGDTDMKTTTGCKIVTLAGLLLVLAGCSEIPLTGRKQLNLIPDSMINSLSLQQYSQYIASNKVSPDQANTALVKKVGEKTAQAVDDYCTKTGTKNPFAGYQWEFNLVIDPNANAFAMPGGKVVVNTGILPVTKTEAGLATVLAHEIAHVFARHGGERMTQGYIAQFGGMAISEAIKKQPDTIQQLFSSSYGVGSQVVLLKYSRDQESEADHLGLIFMAMAGYDPHESLAFWQRMADLSKDQSKSPEFLSTHPSNATRIADIQKLLPEALTYYNPPKK